MTWASFNGRSFFPSSIASKRGREDGERNAEEHVLDGFYPNVVSGDNSEGPEGPEGLEGSEGPRGARGPGSPGGPGGPEARGAYEERHFTPGRRFQPRESVLESEDVRFGKVCASFFYKGTLPSNESDRKHLFAKHPFLVAEADVVYDTGPHSMSWPSASRSVGFMNTELAANRFKGRRPTIALLKHVAKIPRAMLFSRDTNVPDDVDIVGDTLADFLSEVATVAVPDRHDSVYKHDKRVATDEQHPSHVIPSTLESFTNMLPGETFENYNEASNVISALSDMIRRMKRHDPFSIIQFTIDKSRTNHKINTPPINQGDASGTSLGDEPKHDFYAQGFDMLDLSVLDQVYDRFKRTYQKMRTKENLAYHHNQRNVTLMLESEADVWMACGGSANRLPPSTWITRGILIQGKTGEDEDDGIQSFHSLKDLASDFLDTNTADLPPPFNTVKPYIGNGDTFENQLKKLGILKPKVIDLDEKFRKHKDDNSSRMKTHFDVVDVLEIGGYKKHKEENINFNLPLIGRAADLLVATAILCGLVTTPESPIDQMIYKDLQNPRKIERGISLAEAPLNGELIHCIANVFRHGKELILKEYSTNMPWNLGGPDAGLIGDPEYRRRFIALIRANNEIQKVNRNSVSSDRRARMSEQEHIKRECIYFFKKENGTAAPVNSMFLF